MNKFPIHYFLTTNYITVSTQYVLESDRNLTALSNELIAAALLGLVHRWYYRDVRLLGYKLSGQIVMCCPLLTEEKYS